MERADNIINDQRSEEVQYLISANSGFFEKWSLLCIVALILFSLLASAFIRYPDIVESKVVIHGDNLPSEISSHINGKISKIFVRNGDTVVKDDPIAWIESIGDHAEIEELSAFLDSSLKFLKNERYKDASDLLSQNFLKLGELQISYQTFSEKLSTFNDYLVNDFQILRALSIEEDIRYLKSIRDATSEEQLIRRKMFELAESTYIMNKELFHANVISKEEFRKAEASYLNTSISVPQVESAILLKQSQINQKNDELLVLNHELYLQKQTFEQTLISLKSEVDQWLDQFTIKATQSGEVNFRYLIQENTFINAGEQLGYIISNAENYYAEIIFPQDEFGKIDTGMNVKLRFDGYPYERYGELSGKLDYMSNILLDSGYTGQVTLVNGLRTTQDFKIPFRFGLKAKGLIITKDINLLQRLYYSVLHLSQFD